MGKSLLKERGTQMTPITPSRRTLAFMILLCGIVIGMIIGFLLALAVTGNL